MITGVYDIIKNIKKNLRPVRPIQYYSEVIE